MHAPSSLDLFKYPHLEPRAFFILSSFGTVHPAHFDGSAFHTLLSSLGGYKLIILACPVSDTAPTPPNLVDGDAFILMRGPDVVVYAVVIKPGDHLCVFHL